MSDDEYQHREKDVNIPGDRIWMLPDYNFSHTTVKGKFEDGSPIPALVTVVATFRRHEDDEEPIEVFFSLLAIDEFCRRMKEERNHALQCPHINEEN